MTPPTRARLLAMRAQAEALRAELDALLAEPSGETEAPVAAPAPDSARYRTLEDFAQDLGVGYSTVRRWVDQGMPSLRRGNIVRILTEQAHTWLASRPTTRPLVGLPGGRTS